ncbi:MAG: septal ring lytic transglycosylase RlpA family protein [Acidobacteriaceae bacterium]
MRAWSGIAVLSGALLVIAGCGHRERVAAAPPPPPIAASPTVPNSESGAGAEEVPQGRPIYTEVGVASWYGPPYNNRRSANGKIYDQNAVTAAHRTLPLGTLIRVTNLGNGRSATMRITDRGPFVPGRILDLSLGAAKELGMWRAGTAKVRIDAYGSPKPIYQGGRWCVQIGAFEHARTAKKLEKRLARKYEAASVIEFKGPTGSWVRIRPENGDKGRAIQIVRNIRIEEGAAFLVRLD